VNVCKVYVDEGLSFYHRKLRRDTIVFIPAEVQVKHRAMHGVCKPIEALDVINPEGSLKDHYCKECAGSKTQITRGYLKVFTRSVSRIPFGSLSLQEKDQEGFNL
jgi:hypothetical protein